ncbi:tripartite tricarboxylate transporter TctB family protein [Pseudorhodobacter sp. W20_MBD10_FR17]|uniref:tripartite tricarboxylate transporter TctB family protein n=1 Tax=Pseudorhodobacter sp. W20_MBD10_FR17 TaxID=3240266 RepID=UPI003F94B849
MPSHQTIRKGKSMRQFLLNVRRPKDADHPPHAWIGALGGVGLLVLSIAFVMGGIKMGVGVPRRLGTGAFPVITGIALAMLSVAIIINDLRDTGDAEQPDWVSFLAIGAALAIFALASEYFGLIPAVFLTVVVASLPDTSLRFVGKLLLGALIALGCWGLFIGLLDLPFQAFRRF